MTARLKYCKAILADPAALTALSIPVSKPAADVFQAHQDLTQISRTLSPAESLLKEHVGIARADSKTIEDKIIGRGSQQL